MCSGLDLWSGIETTDRDKIADWKRGCEMIYITKFEIPVSQRNEKYQMEHQAGLELLAYSLRREYGLSFHDLSAQIQKGERGKPYLPDFPQIHFNISHSGSAAVCALGNQPLGIDVEQLRPARLGAVRRMLTDEEKRRLDACPEQDRDLEFFRIWTLKESYAKALGIGLALDFTSVEFSFSRQPQGEIRMKRLKAGAQKENVPWRFAQTVWEDSYVISFCGLEEPGNPILV